MQQSLLFLFIGQSWSTRSKRSSWSKRSVSTVRFCLNFIFCLFVFRWSWFSWYAWHVFTSKCL